MINKIENQKQKYLLKVKELKDVRNYSYTEISEYLGVPRSTVRDWYKTAKKTDHVEKPTFEESDDVVEPEKTEMEKFLENLAPIKVTSWDSDFIRESYKVTENDYAMVIGDMHFPMSDGPTIDIFFQVVRELKPKKIVLNGDTIDMMAISKYPKDVRYNYSLLEERIAYHKFLHTLIEVAGNAEIFETNANHSGNDVTGRWFRYLSDKIGELASLPDMAEKLSYQNVFMGKYAQRIKLVDYVELVPDFIVLHGDVVRGKGGASALGHLDKWHTNLMHNHTHRFGSTAKRLPAIGSVQEKQIYAFENSCACSLIPVYSSAPNWQNGFSIISLGSKEDNWTNGLNFGVEQVMVSNNSAVVTTVGKTFKFK
jgi:DNA-binding transcriptional regulator YiaG